MNIERGLSARSTIGYPFIKRVKKTKKGDKILWIFLILFFQKK